MQTIRADAYRIRPAAPADAAACLLLRGRTRENAISVAELAARGITLDSWRADIASGRLPGYVACDATGIVGYCFGDRHAGEIVVLAMDPAHEGEGLGRALLDRVVTHLRAAGHRRLFLETSVDPASRAHGFYRHLGWRPTGKQVGRGDEVLELPGG